MCMAVYEYTTKAHTLVVYTQRFQLKRQVIRYSFGK